MLKILVLICCLGLRPCYSQLLSFDQALEKISEHPSIKALDQERVSLGEQARMKASWGDPQARVQFKNYPVDSLKGDQSAMSGIDFTLAQQLPLSSRYGLSGKSMSLSAEAAGHKANWQRQLLIKDFWAVLIDMEWLQSKISIVDDSINWIEKMKEVSKKLYIVGKVGQENLYELNLRSSELHMKRVRFASDIKRLESKLHYLLGSNTARIDLAKVPWSKMDQFSGDGQNEVIAASKKMVESTQYEARAATLRIIPDATITLTYTKRENLDKMGDFVSAMISIPLPFSDTKYADRKSALARANQAQSNFSNALADLERELRALEAERMGLEEELQIIDKSALRDALNSRNLLAKSYANGRVEIFSLMRGEMTLNDTRENRLNLISKIKNNKVTQSLLKGVL